MPKGRSRGMLPGEYMKHSTVLVYDENPLARSQGGRETLVGREERPEFYVAVVRRRDLKWRIEILRGVPIDDGVIPDEVFTRIESMKDRIISEQRSDRGRDQALLRKVDQDDGNQPEFFDPHVDEYREASDA